LINRLKKIGRWKEDKTVAEQHTLLNSYLKNPKNKRFRPGSYVLPNISMGGKFGEKGTNLKVVFPLLNRVLDKTYRSTPLMAGVDRRYKIGTL
jgi:hypothetical protein